MTVNSQFSQELWSRARHYVRIDGGLDCLSRKAAGEGEVKWLLREVKGIHSPQFPESNIISKIWIWVMISQSRNLSKKSEYSHNCAIVNVQVYAKFACSFYTFLDKDPTVNLLHLPQFFSMYFCDISHQFSTIICQLECSEIVEGDSFSLSFFCGKSLNLCNHFPSEKT